MKFQSYKEKMAILFETAKFPITESNTLVTPIENLSFRELDELCTKENILMIEMPNFSFNFSTMRIEGPELPAPISMKLGKLGTNALIKPFHVNSHSFESMDKFYSDFWNENDLFFFYSGVKVSGNYKLRILKVEYKNIEKAVKRFEAITRLNKSISLSNTVEEIQSYVNSEIFKDDMAQANVDMNEIAKDLYQSYNMEPTPGECIPPVNQFERMTRGIEPEMFTLKAEIFPTGIIDNDAFTNEKSESDGENSSSSSGEGH